MRVLITTIYPQHIGGLNSHIFSLKKKLDEQNIECDILLNKELNYWEKTKGIFLNFQVFLKNLRILSMNLKQDKLLNLIERQSKQYDIYHFHDIFSLAKVKKKPNSKYILTVHGPASKETEMLVKDNPKYIEYVKELEKIAYEKADRIIAVDNGQKDILVKEYFIKETKIDVIFNSLDTDFFKPDYDIESQKVIFVPRRLVPKNGVDIAIKAMPYVDKNVILNIAGDGPEKDNLKKLVDSLKLEKRVNFLGGISHDKLYENLIKSSIVVVPSVPVNGVIEATSISALEGMSCGKLVIASEIGGLKEMIDDGENGILFEAGNFLQLSEKINYSFNNLDKILEIEKKARQSVLLNYSSGSWCKKIVETYEK